MKNLRFESDGEPILTFDFEGEFPHSDGVRIKDGQARISLSCASFADEDLKTVINKALNLFFDVTGNKVQYNYLEEILPKK